VKIAFVSESLDISFGGPAKSIPNLVGGLKSFVDDIKIFIVKNKDSRLKNDFLKQLNVNYQTYNIDFEYKIDYSRSFGLALTDFLQQDERAIVHVNNLWRWTPYKALRIAQTMKRKTVLSARGMLLDSALSKNKHFKFIIWRLLFRSLVSRVDCIHVTSLAEAKAIRGMDLRVPVAVIPHGIDPYRAVSSEQKVLAKEGLNLSTDRSYILFLSRITEHKGLHLLIEAFANISKSVDKFDILIAGDYEDSEYKTIVENMVLDYKLTNRVKFLGEVSGQKKDYAYCAASLFVLPSRSENFGIVIGEALSHGLPVVTTHGTPWSVLSNIGIGAWVPRRVKDIESQIYKFCSMTPEMFQSIQPVIRSTVSDYSWEKSSQDMFELYSWLVEDKAAPDFILL